MADTAAPAPAASDAGAPPAPSAPDWVPADFAGDWGTDAYPEKLSRAYAEKHAKLSTRTDDLRKQVAAELEADRRRGLPEKPEGYTFEAPEGAEYAKLLAEHKVKLVEQLPEGPNTGDETLYAIAQDGDATGWWREMCHKLGLPIDVYREGIARIVVRDVRKTFEARDARAKQFADFDKAELGKLGPQGTARKEAAAKGLSDLAAKLLGPEKGKDAAASLGEALYTAAGVEAVEQILKMTAGGLSPGAGGQQGGPRPADLMFPGLVKRA